MRHTHPAWPGNATAMTASAVMHPPMTFALCLIAAACLLCQTGCTSALTTAYLRDAVWEGLGHAAELGPAATPADETSPPDSAATSGGVEDDIAADRSDTERRQAAIEEALERLSRIGTLDAAAQATLVATLQSTQQEDWPVVIEAFSATLAETQPPTVPAVDASVPDAGPTTGAPATPSGAAAAVPEPEFPPEPVAESSATTAVEPPAARQVAAPESPVETAPSLAVRNACFASRVQAWGVVDRFPDERLAAGQQVIVYFELDGLTAGESPAGFTTCIDTALRLVTKDGRELHAWKFEPVAETCLARRRDYFARYVVQLPASVAGPCRVEVTVTDTLAGATATAGLPCVVE
jgi:hypothetical protein